MYARDGSPPAGDGQEAPAGAELRGAGRPGGRHPPDPRPPRRLPHPGPSPGLNGASVTRKISSERAGTATFLSKGNVTVSISKIGVISFLQFSSQRMNRRMTSTSIRNPKRLLSSRVARDPFRALRGRLERVRGAGVLCPRFPSEGKRDTDHAGNPLSTVQSAVNRVRFVKVRNRPLLVAFPRRPCPVRMLQWIFPVSIRMSIVVGLAPGSRISWDPVCSLLAVRLVLR